MSEHAMPQPVSQGPGFEMAAQATAQKLYNMLKQAGASEIEHLDPSRWATPAPDAIPAGQIVGAPVEENKDVITALDRLQALLQRQVALLDRFEAAIRRFEAQQYSLPSVVEMPGVSKTTLPEPRYAPQQDVGSIWARGLKDRAPGTE